MLNYNILESKPAIQIPSDADGLDYVVCKDLFTNSIGKNINIEDFNLLTVTREYTARPDLISLAIYGSDEYADVLCKVNGISNPFELNEGMVLIIPKFGNIENMFTRSSKSELINDNDTIGNIQKTNQKPKNSVRNPAEQVVGDKNYTIDKQNKIVYY